MNARRTSLRRVSAQQPILSEGLSTGNECPLFLPPPVNSNYHLGFVRGSGEKLRHCKDFLRSYDGGVGWWERITPYLVEFAEGGKRFSLSHRVKTDTTTSQLRGSHSASR